MIQKTTVLKFIHS